jgi:hypothetical protein
MINYLLSALLFQEHLQLVTVRHQANHADDPVRHAVDFA